MKTSACFVPGVAPRQSAGNAGFTLPEMLIAISLFLLVVSGVLTAHLFGYRLSLLTESRLETNRTARQILGQLSGEIRNCSALWIGNVTNGVFAENLDGLPQTGNALLVQTTTNASDFIVYFLNSADHSFRRTAGVADSTSIIAKSVTNEVVFSARDFGGNVLTNNQNTRLIHLTLEFFQPQPHLPAPDRYRLETSVSRRSLE